MSKKSQSSSDKRDPLSVACELVGRFQYHFSKIEAALDRGIAKVLELNEGAALVVCANLEFVKKHNIIKAAVALQFTDTTGRLERLLNRAGGINDPDRQILIHSTFEPHGDGVRFTRVTARGTLDHKKIDWNENKFAQSFKNMDEIASELSEIIDQLQPYTPSLDFSDPRNSKSIYLLL